MIRCQEIPTAGVYCYIHAREKLLEHGGARPVRRKPSSGTHLIEPGKKKNPMHRFDPEVEEIALTVQAHQQRPRKSSCGWKIKKKRGLLHGISRAGSRCVGRFGVVFFFFTRYKPVRCNGGHLYTHRSLFCDAIKNQLNNHNKC
jgi:hypothetical protein